MVIGERVVVGDIKEREKARAIYEQAKADGQKAAWSSRSGRTSSPTRSPISARGETVVVQIEYQEPVRQSGDVFSLRVPLVVAPRYNPAPIVQTVDFATANGWGNVTDPVPDRDRIEPPVLDPRKHAPVNPVAHHGAPQGRLSARRGQEPPPQRHDRRASPTTRASSSLPTARCRPIAISS